MVRKIIKIDEEKCNGCGICASACHEGAIDIIDGKAKLVREHFCDGFGDCLPACPTGAITFEEREAPEYDEKAVLAAKEMRENSIYNQKTVTAAQGKRETHKNDEKAALAENQNKRPGETFHQCPGSMLRQMNRAANTAVNPMAENENAAVSSELQNWPVQIKLAPLQAPYFEGAKLLIAADCTAYAYANFHKEFMKGKVALIGCPKLDAMDYSEKLTSIIKNNNITEVTVVRMEVPCCGGLEMAAKKALQDSGKFIPWQVVTIGIEGKILD